MEIGAGGRAETGTQLDAPYLSCAPDEPPREALLPSGGDTDRHAEQHQTEIQAEEDHEVHLALQNPRAP